jgi:hypothetical protein
MINEHPIKEKNKGRWLIIILVILVVCMVCTAITGALAIGIIRYSGGDGFSLPWKKPELDDPQGDVMMLVATSNGLTAYIFNADIDPPTLPSGIYYAEIKTVDDTTWACSQLSVLDEGTGFGHIDLANQDCTPLKGESDDIETLVRFLISADQLRLTYLDIVSNAFQEPLFTPNMLDGWVEEQLLMLVLENLGDQTKIIEAAYNFFERSYGMLAPNKPTKPLASPNANPIDKIIAFLSITSEETEQARQDILSVYPYMSEWEKESAYEALPPGLQINSTNFDEFIQKVERNEISGLTSIRRDLFTIGPYSGLWQTLNPDSNRPSGEIIHRVGAKALQRGAELYVDLGKGVLSVQFAGIDSGFEYVDKVNEWTEFVRSAYFDPKQALTDEVRNQIEGALSDYIKDGLLENFPDLEEAIAEDLADRIKDRMISAVIETEEQPATEYQPLAPIPEIEEDGADVEPIESAPPETESARPDITEVEPVEPETEEQEDPFIEARYVGTFTDTLLMNGCTASGYFELLLYSNNQASIGMKTTADSCADSVYSELVFTDPNQGSHGAGIFTITLREGFDLIGQYDETGFSGSMQDALFLFLCSGEWVP